MIQEAYNKEHGIVPATVIRAVMNINPAAGTTDYYEIPKIPKAGKNGKIADVDIVRADQRDARGDVHRRRGARLRARRAPARRAEAPRGARRQGRRRRRRRRVYDPYANGAKKKSRGSGSRGASSSNNAASKAKASGGGRGRYKR